MPCDAALSRFLETDLYDVEGEMVDIFDLFSLSKFDQNTIIKRLYLLGLPPLDAIFMPRKKLEKMTTFERLLRGWGYWCRLEGMEDHDTWDWPCELERRHLVRWSRPSAYSNSEEMCADCLGSDMRKDPESLMRLWIQISCVELGVTFPHQVRIARFHCNAKQLIPLYDEHFKVMGRQLCGCGEVKNVLGFLGLCAYLRRRVAEELTLELVETKPIRVPSIFDHFLAKKKERDDEL